MFEIVLAIAIGLFVVAAILILFVRHVGRTSDAIHNNYVTNPVSAPSQQVW